MHTLNRQGQLSLLHLLSLSKHNLQTHTSKTKTQHSQTDTTQFQYRTRVTPNTAHTHYKRWKHTRIQTIQEHKQHHSSAHIKQTGQPLSTSSSLSLQAQLANTHLQDQDTTLTDLTPPNSSTAPDGRHPTPPTLITRLTNTHGNTHTSNTTLVHTQLSASSPLSQAQHSTHTQTHTHSDTTSLTDTHSDPLTVTLTQTHFTLQCTHSDRVSLLHLLSPSTTCKHTPPRPRHNTHHSF